MSDPYNIVDSLIKDYLHFRGFTSSLKSFEMDVGNAKDKKFKVDAVVDDIVSCIEKYDIISLRGIFEYLNVRVFTNLTTEQTCIARQLENDIYRLYLVNTIQNRKPSKSVEFFEKNMDFLRNNNQWNEWFSLPYINNPSESEVYKRYFTKQWHEILLVSLHNFLSIAFSRVKGPTLVECINEILKNDSIDGESSSNINDRIELPRSRVSSFHSFDELMDDFAIIAQATNVDRNKPNKGVLISMLKNIAGSRS
uniref:LisH domain-containing protein n=1 Tax=Parastrongyloides trichosuri TaxID=131310 RepID=A0A0N4Z6R8_PARTI